MFNKIEINLKTLVNPEWLSFTSSQSMNSKKFDHGLVRKVRVRKYQLLCPFEMPGKPCSKRLVHRHLEVEGHARMDRGSLGRLMSDHSITAFPPLKSQQGLPSVLSLHILFFFFYLFLFAESKKRSQIFKRLRSQNSFFHPGFRAVK